MTKVARGFWPIVNRILTYRRAIKVFDAVLLAFSDGKKGEFKTRLRLANRDIALRLGTSDIPCLVKIFVDKEYSSPFKIEPKLIIDAGANIGMATLYFITQYPDAKIFAIEPEPTNFALLQKNCAGLKNVTLINAALWPEQRPLSVHTSENGNWASWVSEKPEGGIKSQSVRSITIAEILKHSQMEKVDLLKLDIEGAELDLFSSKVDMWLANVCVIAIELHDRIRAHCAQTFYTAINSREYHHEINGENIFIQFRDL